MVDGPGALNPLMALVGDVDNVSCLGLDVGIVVTPSTTPNALDAPAPGLPSFCPTSVGRLLCRRLFQPRSERPSQCHRQPYTVSSQREGDVWPCCGGIGRTKVSVESPRSMRAHMAHLVPQAVAIRSLTHL